MTHDDSTAPPTNLADVRQAIDSIDAQIIALLKERFQHVHQVGVIKQQTGSPIFVPERETDLIKKLEQYNQGSIPAESLRAIYREIISCSLALEGGIKVAYLGPVGTWSHMAALKQFGSSVELSAEQNFKDIFELVAKDKVNYGIIPIENSTEGAVSAAMDLFMEYDVTICAQLLLPIRNSLLAAIPREEIQVIYSHPQVIGQSLSWILRNFPQAEIVETTSTTKAAQLAKENTAIGAASLGNPLAAELFGLNVIEENVQDKLDNTTRFAVIGKQQTVPTGHDRTSIMFYVHHEPGTLVKALRCFDSHKIDLTRIESRPSKSINWEYVFFVDACGHASEEPLQSAVKELKSHCFQVKILGSYPV